MKNFVQELKLNFILTALFCILCGGGAVCMAGYVGAHRMYGPGGPFWC